MVHHRNALRTGLLSVFSANVLTGTVNLGVQVYLARVLGAQIIGEYAQLAVALDLIILFVNFGFNQAVIRLGASQDHVSAAFFLVMIQSLLAVSFAAGLFWITDDPRSDQAPGFVVLMLAARIAGFFATLAYAPLEGELKYGKVAIIQAVAALSGAAAALVIAGDGEGIGALVAREVVAAAVMVALALVLGRPKGFAMRPSRQSVVQMFQFSRTMWQLNVLEKAATRLDYVVVSVFLGTSMLGVYYQVRMLMEGVLGFVLSPVQTLWYSYMCRVSDKRGVFRRVLRLGWRCTWIVLPLVLLFGAIYGDSLIAISLGHEWRDGGVLIPFFAVYAFALVLFEFCKVGSMAAGVHQRLPILRLAQIGVSGVLSVMLLSRYGLIGAGLAMSVAAFVLGVSSLLRTLTAFEAAKT